MKVTELDVKTDQKPVGAPKNGETGTVKKRVGTVKNRQEPLKNRPEPLKKDRNR